MVIADKLPENHWRLPEWYFTQKGYASWDPTNSLKLLEVN